MNPTGSVPPLCWQASLFADESGVDEPAADLSFAGLRRYRLDGRSWVDHAPNWLAHSDELFEQLYAQAPWQQRQRHMYDQLVDEPRLVAAWGTGAAADPPRDLPPRLGQLRAALSAHYAVEFDSVLVNLYRDGRDGVAWHGDTVRKVLVDPLVATVSLGQRRRFQLRPGRRGPVAWTFALGEGDLLVMGGACQHEWQHCVPKVAAAGARMSVTLRHSTPAGRG